MSNTVLFILLTFTSLPAFSQAIPALGQRSVVRVVDGDTIVLDGNEHVRLIGIDAPEMARERRAAQCFALQSAGYLSKLLERDKKVTLESDPTGDAKDIYGRTLAYVFLEDGRMINGEMVRRGYARAYLRFPFKFQALFRRYEESARSNKAGVWGRCGP